MRLKTFVAPDTRQGMTMLRAELGDNAIIVATRELPEGGVRITGAIESQDLDLAELLVPGEASPGAERLRAVLAHHEVPEPLCRRLLDDAQRAGSTQPAVALAHALAEAFGFAPWAAAPTGALLLAGPPGGGKTASLAKLAAAAVLEGRSVTVVTTDSARAGGLAQLAALLAPLELEPVPAPEPAALRRIVQQTASDTLLIDSPGLNPFRRADLGVLSSLLEASRAEPVLVLPAGLGVADCAEIGHTYLALGARRMLATKLDAARRLGGLLAAADAGLAFAEGAIGPTIGPGLRPLTAGGLARLLLRHQELAGARGAEPRPAAATPAASRSA